MKKKLARIFFLTVCLLMILSVSAGAALAFLTSMSMLALSPAEPLPSELTMIEAWPVSPLPFSKQK